MKSYVFKLTMALLLILGVLAPPVAAFASNISSAIYSAQISVSSNVSTTTTGAIAAFNLNPEALQTTYGVNSDFSNVAIRNSGGTDIPFMPGGNATLPWMVYAGDILPNSTLNENIYLGGSSDMASTKYIIAQSTTIPDAAGMEPGNNWAVSFNNTLLQDNETFVSKPQAVYAFTSSGNNTVLIGNSANITPGAVSGNWTNPGNARDGNIGTFASENVSAGWSDYLTFSTIPSNKLITGISFYANKDASITKAEVDYYDGSWNVLYSSSGYKGSTWFTANFTTPTVISQARIRLYHSLAGYQGRVYEFKLTSSDIKATIPLVGGEQNPTTAQQSFPYLAVSDGTVSGNITPVSGNLVMNAPLSQSDEYAVSGGNFTTIDGGAHTITNEGASWSLGQGYSLNGSTRLSVRSSFDALPATGSISVIWNVYPTTSVGNIDALARNYYGAGGFALRTSQNDGNYNVIVYAGGTTHQLMTGVSVPVNQWTQLGFSYTNGSLVAYKNGVEVDNGGVGWGAFANPSSTLYIGFNSDGAYWTGTEGGGQIYDVVLTPAQFLQNYNATKYQFTGSGHVVTVSTLASVPDNANNWTVGQGVPYYSDFQLDISGVNKCSYGWSYGATFTDTSGNGNVITPTFYTTSPDAGISASLNGFGPISQAAVTSYSINVGNDVVTGNATSPAGMYTELQFANIPGASAINDILAAGDVPQALWWFPFVFYGIVVVGFIAYGGTTIGKTQRNELATGQLDGSLLTMAFVVEALLVLFNRLGVIPFWPAELMPIPMLALILSRKHFSWG